jgi:hypothetical protein
MLRYHSNTGQLGTAVALLLVMVFAPAAGSAQQPAARKAIRVPATVAMVDRLPVPDAPFVVQRRPTGRPMDLILVRSTTTPAELSDAVRTLATARATGGDYPFERATVRIRPQQKVQTARSEFPWTHGVLARLRNAKPQPIDGVGTVPAVAIWLPRQKQSFGPLSIPKNP